MQNVLRSIDNSGVILSTANMDLKQEINMTTGMQGYTVSDQDNCNNL